MPDSPSSSKLPESLPSSGSAVLVPWDRFERFVGQLTHDVRNGLNAVELQLTFLGEISTDPEAIDEVKRLRGTLHQVTKQLQAVKTATAPVSPHPLDYPADDLFEDIRERLERFQPGSVGKIAWNTGVGPTVLLLVDPDHTIQCLLELCTNSLHFGGSSIRCGMTEDPGHVSFILQEVATAVNPIAIAHWGQPLLSSRRNAYGLGLFRARRLLEAQGGSLDFSYSPEDHVLTTTARLPRVPPAA